MAAFIAGASSTGQRMARNVVLRRSSATPEANLASALAVAGATTNRSAHLASAMCAISSRAAKRSVWTGLPLSVASVIGAMNWQACSVITARTSAPSFFSRLMSSAAR